MFASIHTTQVVEGRIAIERTTLNDPEMRYRLSIGPHGSDARVYMDEAAARQLVIDLGLALDAEQSASD